MKTLYILRHAKSSWSDANLADFERPLNSRGLEEATFIGNYIYENKLQPKLVVSSPAKRAKHTAVLVKETAQITADIKFEERIYEASPQMLRQVVSETEDENASVMLVGHNPGLEGLIKLFTGEELAMPTAGFVKINLDIQRWGDIVPGVGQLDLMVRPKDELKSLRAD